jgi:hypothetical protein
LQLNDEWLVKSGFDHAKSYLMSIYVVEQLKYFIIF